MSFLNKKEIEAISKKHGFKMDTLEKVVRLLDILTYIQSSDLLSKHLVLKGGTAINILIWDLPRLSVDIDLDFNYNYSKEEMLKYREKISNNISNYLKLNGYTQNPHSKKTFALDSFVYSFTNMNNQKDHIKIEINYMNRCHILEPVDLITKIPFLKKISIKTLNTYELYGSKIKALIERCTIRDVYDVHYILKNNYFNEDELVIVKKCVIFYFILGKTSFIELSNITKDFEIKINTFRKKLIPQHLSSTLRKTDNLNLIEAVDYVKEFIKNFLILNENELQFLNEFKIGNYKPEILFDDEEILSRIRNHPMVLWKLKNLE